MERGSSLLIYFLLANFACIFVAMAGASCNWSASESCLRPRHREMDRNIAAVFTFLKNDLNNACRSVNEIIACVKNVTKNCNSNENNPLKKKWGKIEDSVNHVCKKNFQKFNENKQCLSNDELVSAAVNCEKTHGIHQRYARHTCSDYEKGVECINKAIEGQCGLEGRNLMDLVIRNFLSLADIDHDCDHNSSGKSTEGSTIFNFILSTAAVMLAMILN